MAFKLDKKPYYKLPVTCSTSADGGAQESESFTVYFARIGQERVNEIIEKLLRRNTQIKNGERLDDDLLELTDVFVANEVLVGWEEITNEGEEVPYTSSTKERFLNEEGVASAIVSAWAESKQADTAKKQTSRKSRGIG
jgi:hypothetical protein